MTTQPTDGPAGLRAALERTQTELKEAKAENAKLLEQVKGIRIEKAGFPAEQHPHGHKQLVKSYEGDLDDTAAIQAFAAEEFGYTPVEGAPAAPGDGPDDPGAVLPGDARAADLRSTPGAAPVTPPDSSQRGQFVAAIQAAEADGRSEDAIALRTQLAALEHRQQQ